uniref:oligosaccharide flippase family protein n=1 Tax=Flavobacterium sp. TaxID=239 RepID=UPI0040490562
MFTFSNLLKRGANYLLMVLLARSVSITMIGTYSAYINVIGIILLITNFGFSEFLLVNSENEKLRKKNTSIFLEISIIIFLILILSSLLIPIKDLKLVLLTLCKIFLDTSIYNILLSYYQTDGLIKKITLSNVLSGLGVITISSALYLFDKSIYLYLLLINCLYILVFLIHIYHNDFKIYSLKKIISYIKEKFSSLKYYGITMITIPIYMMAPTVIGSFILPPEIIAQYQIAFSISNILLLISVSLLQVEYVKFLQNQNDIVKLTKLLKLTSLKILSVNFIILVFFIIFGKDLLLFVYKNPLYIEAYTPLIILLIGNIIFMFASVSAVLMVIRKLQKLKAKYHIEFIIVSIVFGFIMTYTFGIYGLTSSYIILYTYSTFRYLKKYISLYRKEI